MTVGAAKFGLFAAAGVGGGGPAGYFAGGSTGSDTAIVERYAFPAETRSTITGLSVARDSLGAMADSGTAGYFGGGSPTSAVVDRYAFSAETRSTITALSAARWYFAAMANSGTL